MLPTEDAPAGVFGRFLLGKRSLRPFCATHRPSRLCSWRWVTHTCVRVLPKDASPTHRLLPSISLGSNQFHPHLGQTHCSHVHRVFSGHLLRVYFPTFFCNDGFAGGCFAGLTTAPTSCFCEFAFQVLCGWQLPVTREAGGSSPAARSGLPERSTWAFGPRVTDSRELLTRCCQLLTAVFDSGGRVSLEQPPSAMSWEESVVSAFLLRGSASLVYIPACVFGVSIHKAWLFATTFAPLIQFATVCSHDRGAHLDVRGLRDEWGGYFSQQTEGRGS